mgnify:CR=1 FL=1
MYFRRIQLLLIPIVQASEITASPINPIKNRMAPINARCNYLIPILKLHDFHSRLLVILLHDSFLLSH